MSANTITRSIEIGLRVAGIWPGAAYTVVNRLLWTTTMIAAQIFQYRHMALHLNSEDISQLMDGLSATLSYSLLCVKLIVFWTKQRYVVVAIPDKPYKSIIRIDWRASVIIAASYQSVRERFVFCNEESFGTLEVTVSVNDTLHLPPSSSSHAFVNNRF